MNLDQTVPKGAVWSGSLLFAIKDIILHKQKVEHLFLYVPVNNIAQGRPDSSVGSLFSSD